MSVVRRRTAIIAAIAFVVAWSCTTVPTDAEVRTQDVTSAGATKLLGLNLSFLKCSALDADSVTQAVDSTGGTISFGPHTLVIPAGALDTAVNITAIAPSDTVRRVELYPEGLTFNTDVSLTLSYQNCSVLGRFLPRTIVYVDGGLNILSLIPSLDSFFTKTVTGSLEHFSGYAVAW